jgi:phytanoyl-CoA hydroxylase
MFSLKNNPVANAVKSYLREAIITQETPWYNDIAVAKAKAERDISNQDVLQKVFDLIEKGYCVVPNTVDSKKIDAALESYQSWKMRNLNAIKPFMRNEIALDRIINIHNTLTDFLPLFTENTSLQIQDFLNQGETALYTSLFFEQGSTQGIHRDIPVFWTYPGCQYFGTWLAMEKTDHQNGPLIVMAKGHLLPQIDRAKIGAEFFVNANDIPANNEEMWNRYQTQVREMCTKMGLVEEEVHVNKGDTIIWHPLLPHGGAPIVDWNRTRYSFVVHTTPVNVPVYHQDVFFNPQRKVFKKAQWGYQKIGNRHIASTGGLSIGHGHSFDFSTLS